MAIHCEDNGKRRSAEEEKKGLGCWDQGSFELA